MQYAEVALTTIGPPLDELAVQAAELIVSLIRDEQVDVPVVIQPKLNLRNSTAVSHTCIREYNIQGGIADAGTDTVILV